MKKNIAHRGALVMIGGMNRLQYLLFTLLQPLYRKVRPSDVAYLYCNHPVLTPFVLRMITRANIHIHLLGKDEDGSKYRKVIVPNGMWPEVKEATRRIPPEKRVYCEVGFFPQNRNIYFDAKGVHGYSSIRGLELEPLTPKQKSKLETFRHYYTKRNFIKLSWATVDNRRVGAQSAAAYPQSFLFVPLQLESDTAFNLCPFNSNQQMIEAIERALPEKRVMFKVHPWDVNSDYSVADHNLLLPCSNTDLRRLIVHCDAVISCNSTVMLEALLYGKRCASLGTGFATNHHITLECHKDIDRLRHIDNWRPNKDKVDRFLHQLLTRQVSTEWFKRSEEREKLMHWMRYYEICPA